MLNGREFPDIGLLVVVVVVGGCGGGGGDVYPTRRRSLWAIMM